MTSTLDMREVVRELLRKSRGLRKAAHAIAEAYDIEIASKRPENRDIARNGDAAGHAALTRPEQLRRYLDKNGPSRRSAILKSTKIPIGTIGALLKENCERNEEGLWQWKGEGKAE